MKEGFIRPCMHPSIGLQKYLLSPTICCQREPGAGSFRAEHFVEFEFWRVFSSQTGREDGTHSSSTPEKSTSEDDYQPDAPVIMPFHFTNWLSSNDLQNVDGDGSQSPTQQQPLTAPPSASIPGHLRESGGSLEAQLRFDRQLRPKSLAVDLATAVEIGASKPPLVERHNGQDAPGCPKPPVESFFGMPLAAILRRHPDGGGGGSPGTPASAACRSTAALTHPCYGSTSFGVSYGTAVSMGSCSERADRSGIPLGRATVFTQQSQRPLAPRTNANVSLNGIPVTPSRQQAMKFTSSPSKQDNCMVTSGIGGENTARVSSVSSVASNGSSVLEEIRPCAAGLNASEWNSLMKQTKERSRCFG
ncbi:unnamed protein product [Anisakis simplex]|uniref:Uncharacterized protein n=1 Tax=Anisakis simplex TaxID=6269 RepID=A0A0M3KF75_ANISI|nr:unnamed protein product [Anisakis simplex]